MFDLRMKSSHLESESQLSFFSESSYFSAITKPGCFVKLIPIKKTVYTSKIEKNCFSYQITISDQQVGTVAGKP